MTKYRVPDKVERELLALDLLTLQVVAEFVNQLIRDRANEMPSLFAAACPLCFGTGRVGEQFCTCDAGVEVKQRSAANAPKEDYSDCPLFGGA